jgi:hypothetical protein
MIIDLKEMDSVNNVKRIVKERKDLKGSMDFV